MSSSLFVVVEFVDEQSVEVVPKSWIVYENEQLFGYWPRKDPVCRVRRSELPDPKWPLYKIRTFGAAVESYSKASDLAKRALVTSNVEDTDINKETSSDIEDETSSGDHSPPNKKIKLISAQRYNAKQKKATFTETSSGDHSPLSKKITLPSAPKYSAKQNNGKNASLKSTNASLQEQTAVSSQVFQNVRHAAVSAAANIFHSPSASLSQVNLAHIASTDRMSSENANIRRPFIDGTMVDSLTDSNIFAGGRAGVNTVGTYATKLDIIIENQEEIKAMLRSLVAVSRDDVSDDVFPQKMKNEHDLRQLEIKLKDPSYRKKMINYFGSLGGRNCKDAIRRIMRTTATNQLWSLFSFNGRKGKLSFESCLLCQVVMKACKNIIKGANEQKIEDEIREVLKHASNRPGGVNYEAKIVANTPSNDVLLRLAEESSDSENTE